MKRKTFVFWVMLLSSFVLNSAMALEWPELRKYDLDHSCKVAMPIGGIGAGTLSLGGIGNLQDFEIMNRPAKGYNPAIIRENSARSTKPNVATTMEGPWPAGRHLLRCRDSTIPELTNQCLSLQNPAPGSGAMGMPGEPAGLKT